MSPIHYVRTDKLPAVRAGAALNKSKLTTPPWPYLKYSFPTSPSPASIKLHLLLIPIPPPSDFPRALRALDLLVPPVVSENMYFILDYTATETVAELQVGGPEEGYRVRVSRLRRGNIVFGWRDFGVGEPAGEQDLSELVSFLLYHLKSR